MAFVLSGVSILLRAIQALKSKTVSIELLVSIASVGACVIGEFNEAAIVTFLFQLGSFWNKNNEKDKVGNQRTDADGAYNSMEDHKICKFRG